MSSAKRSQPSWTPPEPLKPKGKLKLYNSLTREKTEFIPRNGNRINWYNCGPTVYDSAHMGHARSYISFDIIRRVLDDYFNYDLFYVMNITDIDDKIIRRARQRFLFEKYVEEMQGQDKDAVGDVKRAVDFFKNKLSLETDEDKKTMMTKLIASVDVALASVANDPQALVLAAKDVLPDYFDSLHGMEVTDNSIFASLPRQYESEFNQDMSSLNVLPPDVVTRVSEYVPEIVAYIQKIIENGYAYESRGSVYFHTLNFDGKKAKKGANDATHYYAKLVPEAVGDSKALSEGEGDLAVVGDKRHPNDFALWKCSKPGEPSWDSPWGQGRPGWHIECSVMAGLLGDTLDMHSGGVDLKFPHHDNEIAQAEAYFDTGANWVNYFLHSGHLTISGCKMSKSLKNFITIKEAVTRNSPRQLRLAFLLHSWNNTLDYSENTMYDAVAYEKTLLEFFLNIKDILRRSSTKDSKSNCKWTDLEIVLNQRYHAAVTGVDEALCDNIDTRTALDVVRELISASNIYIKGNETPNGLLLRKVSSFISKLFKIFGAFEQNSLETRLGGTSSGEGNNAVDKEEVMMPLLEALASFREKMRSKGKELRENGILSICDELRDDILPLLGVRLEDKETASGTHTVVKLVDKNILLKEKEAKVRLEEEKRQEKQRKREEQAAKEAKNRINPKDMFRLEVDKYSLFDENGLPTHDVEGKELSKGQIKKLTKSFQQQEKKYNEYLKSLQTKETLNGK